MWQEFFETKEPKPIFGLPASASEISEAERLLGTPFPSSLASLLGESNGIHGEYGLGLLWEAERIAADNAAFRMNADFLELYMPFDCLLFFSDAGNGDQFAFSVLNGQCRRDDVFVWNHEDDSRTWVAPNLKTFYDWWLSGRIQV